MKVSVIIPSYNHEKYLEKRLVSIFNQSFRDFEVIFIDDGSLDQSVDLFKKVAEMSKVSHILINETNKGVFYNWNKGVQLAQGEFIWIAEDDDWADSKFLEKMVSILEQNVNVGLVFSQSRVINERGDDQGKELHCTYFSDDFLMKGKDFVKHYLTWSNFLINASALLIRKSTWEKVGGADEEMKLCGDWFQWIKILSISDIAYTQQVNNYYRDHDQTCRKKYEKTLLILKEHLKIYDYVNNSLGKGFAKNAKIKVVNLLFSFSSLKGCERQYLDRVVHFLKACWSLPFKYWSIFMPLVLWRLIFGKKYFAKRIEKIKKMG